MKLDLMCKRCCALALAFVLSAKCLAAQNAVPPLVPCRDFGCKLIFDWGPGKTVASYPQDRRYGGGDDFEVNDSPDPERAKGQEHVCKAKLSRRCVG